MPDPSDFVIPARIVATVSLLVSLGSIVTLAVIVSVKDVDILSTVALALAILAFVVQLIVYVVQSASASRQLSDARALHGEMMAVLSALQERTAGTQKSIDQIHSQMIDELRTKAYASPSGSDNRQQEAQLEIDASGALQEPIEVIDHGQTSTFEADHDDIDDEYPDALNDSEALAIHNELESWPSSDKIPEYLDELRRLTAPERAGLAAIARDAHFFTEPGRMYAPGMKINSLARRLIELGLAEKVPGWQLVTLSAHGRQLARVFIAEPPTGTPAEIMEMRQASQPPQRASNRDPR